MGRHATAAPADQSQFTSAATGPTTLPITNPALLDRSRPSVPEAQVVRIRPAAVADPVCAAQPAEAVLPTPVRATRAPQQSGAALPAPLPAPRTPQQSGAALQAPRIAQQPDAMLPTPLPAARHWSRAAVATSTPHPLTEVAPRLSAASLVTGPVSIVGVTDLGAAESDDRGSSLRRGTSLALCAVAVLGAVSAGALLLPTGRSSAEAAELAGSTGPVCKADSRTAPMPGRRVSLRHRLHRVHPVAVPATSPAEQAQPSASASDSSTPSASASAAASSTPSTSTPSAPTWSPSGTIRSLSKILSSAVSGRVVALAAGTFTWSNFGSNLVGLDAASSVKGFQGAGIDKTVLEMTPHTSTKAGSVPTALGTTNQLSLMRVTGSPILSDFTLQGTNQGHLYNGLRVAQATDARVSNVRIIGAPGNFDSPPGETFGLNDWRTTGSVYDGVEIDGDGVGAAGFAANSSTDITVNNSYFHDNAYSHGATFWQTKDITINNTRSMDNKDTGFNFERVTGTVTMNHVTTGGNKLADIRIGNDQGSATYRIVDPVYSGSKLKIMLTPTYMGTTNLQQKSQIHVIENGVDVTSSVVEWVTHW